MKACSGYFNSKFFYRVLLSTAIGLLIVFCWMLAHAGVSEINPRNFSDEENSEQENQIRSVLAGIENPDNWLGWRGGNSHHGVVDKSAVPLIWGGDQNIQFKFPLQGTGHASPVVCNQICFCQNADEDQRTQNLQAVDLSSGKELWRVLLHHGEFQTKHKKNSNASSTPVCDGEAVYTVGIHQQNLYASKVSFKGEILWQRVIGPYSTEWGYGSSTVYHQGMLYVLADQKGSGLDRIAGAGYLAMIDCKSGEIFWRIKRSEGDSYGTPVILDAPYPQIVVPGREWIISYDLSNGREFWRYQWGADRSASTLAYHNSKIIASTHKPKACMTAIAIPEKSAGTQIIKEHLWQNFKQVSDIPTPLVFKDRIYVASDNGIVSCLDPDTGKAFWMKRLGGNFSSSPMAVSHRIVVTNEEGTSYVIAASDEYELLAENRLNEVVLSTPAFTSNSMLIRTERHLFCIKGTQMEIILNNSANTDRAMK